MEVGQIRLPEAFDKVFLDSARGRDDAAHVLVLDEVTDDIAQTGRDEVGRVAEKDGALRVSPRGRLRLPFRFRLSWCRVGLVG